MKNVERKRPFVGKRATNVSLDAQVLEEARGLGLNISRACEEGLKRAIADERSRRWLEANREALADSNAYVERNGLPLGRYRQF